MSTYNVSQMEIDNAISYIRGTFMKKLLDNGEAILNEYSKINTALQSQQIDELIVTQKRKLDEIEKKFEFVSNTIKNQMINTSEQVQKSTANINNILMDE